MTTLQFKILNWATKIIALAITIFGLPFYFGYGNPLPFANPEYNLWDNIWLSVFPLMFLGLILGLWFEKIGGYLISIPLIIAFIAGFFVTGELVWFMLIPLLIGISYLILGHQKPKK